MKRTARKIATGAALVATIANVVFDDPYIIDPQEGYQGGQIFVANDSRLNEGFYQEPLTNYVVGFPDTAPLEEELNFICPVVQTSPRFEWAKHENAEAFLSELDDERAPGKGFKTIDYSSSKVQDKTVSKGLTYIADLEVVSGNWRQVRAAMLKRRLLRNELRRGVTALLAAGVNTNVTWDDTAGKNPDQDVKRELIAATNIIGYRPNRVLYGDTAFQTRSECYESQDSPAGYIASELDPDRVAKRLRVSKVRVSEARYQDGSNKTEIVGDKVVMFYADDFPSEEDGSQIKRFTSEAMPGLGMGFAVFEQKISSHLVALTVCHRSKIIVTFASGVRKFTVSA